MPAGRPQHCLISAIGRFARRCDQLQYPERILFGQEVFAFIVVVLLPLSGLSLITMAGQHQNAVSTSAEEAAVLLEVNRVRLGLRGVGA